MHFLLATALSYIIAGAIFICFDLMEPSYNRPGYLYRPSLQGFAVVMLWWAPFTLRHSFCFKRMGLAIIARSYFRQAVTCWIMFIGLTYLFV